MLEVKITVKNPSSQYPDFPIDVTVNNHIKVIDLKKIIEKDYPSNPPANLQKLIFYGKVLQDDALLKDLFDQVCYQTFINHFLSFF